MKDRRDRSADALEADLRAFAHRVAPQPPPQLLDEVLRATQPLPQRARWSLASWPGLAAAAAIVVVAIVVGVGAGLPQRIGLLVSSPTAGPYASGSSSVPPNPTPSPNGSPAASTSPAPSAAPATVYRDWVAAPIPDPQQVFGGEAPEAVVAFRGDFFAVGGVNAGCCDGGFSPDTRALVWRSTNGRSWQLEPNQPVFAQGQMSHLAANATRIVATGFVVVESKSYPGEGEPHGAVWTSDDGIAWTLVTGAPEFTQITAVEEGFLAVSPGLGEPSIWSSPNGRSWHRTADPTGLGPGSIDVLRNTPVGIVAVFSGMDAGGAAQPTVVWVSTDGVNWQQTTSPDAMRNLAIRDVAALGSGLLAIGQDAMTGLPVVLRSSTAFDWQRVETTAFADPAMLLTHLVDTKSGFVALGTDASSGSAVAWVSDAGESWNPVPQSGMALDGLVTGVLVTDDGLLVAVGAGRSSIVHGIPRAWYAMP